MAERRQGAETGDGPRWRFAIGSLHARDAESSKPSVAQPQGETQCGVYGAEVVRPEQADVFPKTVNADRVQVVEVDHTRLRQPVLRTQLHFDGYAPNTSRQ